MNRSLPAGILAFTAAACLLSAAPVRAEQYSIDPARSEIRFSVKNFGAARVQGKFTGFSGTISYSENDAAHSSATASIQTASIDTGIHRRDEHLRGKAFLDSTAYPAMTFESTSVDLNGTEGLCAGRLTLRGITQEVRIPFKITPGERLRIEAGFTLNRRDFGISYNALIGNEVKVALRLEAEK